MYGGLLRTPHSRPCHRCSGAYQCPSKICSGLPVQLARMADTCPAIRAAPFSEAHLYSRREPQPLDVQLRPCACLCAPLHRKHRRARRQDGCQAYGERTAACPQIRPCSSAELWVALQRLCAQHAYEEKPKVLLQWSHSRGRAS